MKDYEVEEEENGEQALEQALKKDYDCILLDIMLPEKDGLQVCSEIREKKGTPIVLLTAKGEETNRVQGFELGADDYIVKPFSPREVVLRVKAILRRSIAFSLMSSNNTSSKDLVVFSHLTIDNDAHRVTADGK